MRRLPLTLLAASLAMATGLATERVPDLIAPFELERFYRDELVSQLAAAAVSH